MYPTNSQTVFYIGVVCLCNSVANTSPSYLRKQVAQQIYARNFQPLAVKEQLSMSNLLSDTFSSCFGLNTE
jgi:predicted metal-dependent RNase